MKKILTLLCLASVTLPAISQITLDQNTYPLPTDSVTVVDITGQVTAAPSAGDNQNWNYTGITPASGTGYYNVYEPVSSDPDFPAAQFVVRGTLKNLTPSVGYYIDQYYTINANGAQAIGIHVPAQAYGLGAFTGNNSDTLYILDNVIYYPTTPRVIVPFPATANSSWQTSVRHLVNMELTVSSASLNRAPMQQAFYMNRQDTVIGWGTLHLPTQAGFNSNVPALEDRIIQYCVDSVYVGGAPASSQLTTAFGITQGQITGPKYAREVFYREGSFNYQMLFNFTDNTFASVSSVFVNTALPVATGINDMNIAGPLSVLYPNPVTAQDFMIVLAPDAKPTSVKIQDLTGRVVERASFTMTNDVMDVHLANSLSGGVYFYSVSDADGAAIAAGKFCASK